MPKINPSKPATQTALITGASSGIGEALGRRWPIALLRPSLIWCWSRAAQLMAALKRKRCHVDVLVNCAGVLEQGAFTAIPQGSHQQIIDFNISGLTAMLSVFVLPMVERGGGRVLNVASIGAFQPVPLLASYAASKAYVLSLSESLSEELKGTGVTVTALCPGITATHMLDKAATANARVSRIPDFLVGDVGDVAASAFDACMQGDAICVPGVINQAAMIASRGTPKWLIRRIGGLLGRKAL